MRKRMCKLTAIAMAAALVLPTAVYASEVEEAEPAGETAAEETAAEDSSSSSEVTQLCYADTEYGPVAGYTYQGVSEFWGIPYAQATRFHDPEAPEAWDDVKACLMQGEVSPQNKTTMETFDAYAYSAEMVENEDTCLNLNVFTANLDGDELKPVIVWLHGGGYETGGSYEKVFYNGASLAGYGDVVVVSVNHRLNCLGYLDLSAYGEEYAHSGNEGMLDIVAALEWIQDNIANFGGDASNVTIMGQSGGGGKVTTLMGMPCAEGLFNQAVCLSGGSVQVTRDTEQAQAETAAVLDILGISPDDIQELETIDYVTLYEACAEAGVSYGPVVDGDIYPTGNFEMSADIPMMICNVEGEMNTNMGNMIFAPGYYDYSGNLSLLTEEDVLATLNQTYDEDTSEAIIAAFREAYPDQPIGAVLFLNNRRNGMFDTYGLAEAMESYGGTVYMAVTAYIQPYCGGVVPVHTAGDVPLWFHNADMIPAWIAGDEENAYKVQDAMSTALCNFAYTGNPTDDGLPWEEWTSDGDAVMVFDVNSEVKYHFDEELFDLMANKAADTDAAADASADADDAYSDIPAEYTKVLTYYGTYGFGDAEITVAMSDDDSQIYYSFICFDEDQIMEGTVEDGVVNITFDLTGFVTQDAQQMYEDALASGEEWVTR